MFFGLIGDPPHSHTRVLATNLHNGEQKAYVKGKARFGQRHRFQSLFPPHQKAVGQRHSFQRLSVRSQGGGLMMGYQG